MSTSKNVTPAKAGVQNLLKVLDSGFRRNDEMRVFRGVLIVICGPTGVGKSDLALKWARQMGAAIISADSQQVWKGCDIGTAKPSKKIQQEIPHYLIDLLEPDQKFDVAQYQQYATAAIQELKSKKQPILVVGGAGLYLRILEYGLCEAPEENPELRNQLRTRTLEDLYQELQKVDPELSKKIYKSDKNRIVRALEVYHQTGKTLAEFQKEHGFSKPRYVMKKIGLRLPREELYPRIRDRVDAMMKAGWLEEVRGLLEKYPPDCQGLLSLGYSQLVSHLQGKISLEEAVELIKIRTRQFAKRQETWFRADPSIQWFRPDQVVPLPL